MECTKGTFNEYKRKDQGIIKDRYELIIRELQNILTFGYLLVIVLGMIFEVGYYASFDINIFEYAGVSDFLLAPFRRPISLAILAFIGIYLVLAYPLDAWFSRKWPRVYRVMNLGLVRAENSTKYRNIMFVITAFALVTMFAVQAGILSAKEFSKKRDNIHIQFSGGHADIYEKKIGQTSSYLFVMDSLGQVIVLPIASQVLLMEEIKRVEKD